MTRAGELAASGAPTGTVVVADFQTHGRGTRGREWRAPAESCLMFTVIGRPSIRPDDLEFLPRRVSLAVASALCDAFGGAFDVKEPNDILIRGRKVCGVLCTSHLVGSQVDWVLSGIGLNTFMQQDELPVPSATSLRVEGVTLPPHPELLELLLARLVWLREP